MKDIPAFPTSHQEPCDYNGHNNSQKTVIDQGMTLRDYFAAKGLEALMVSVTSELQSKHHLIEKANQIKKVYALMCYAMADAMMEARNESQ
jgi:hypothetical protein